MAPVPKDFAGKKIDVMIELPDPEKDPDPNSTYRTRVGLRGDDIEVLRIRRKLNKEPEVQNRKLYPLNLSQRSPHDYIEIDPQYFGVAASKLSVADLRLAEKEQVNLLEYLESKKKTPEQSMEAFVKGKNDSRKDLGDVQLPNMPKKQGPQQPALPDR